MRSNPELDEAIARAGLAKVLRTKLNWVEASQPGAVIVEFEVPGRPVPWKASTVSKNGTFKDKSLVAWQKTVATYAALAMGGRFPYPGPVLLELHFHLTRRPGSSPDVVNLIKALEDSLQGPVIVNDRQTRRIIAEVSRGDWDGAWVRVTSLMGGS